MASKVTWTNTLRVTTSGQIWARMADVIIIIIIIIIFVVVVVVIIIIIIAIVTHQEPQPSRSTLFIPTSTIVIMLMFVITFSSLVSCCKQRDIVCFLFKPLLKNLE